MRFVTWHCFGSVSSVLHGANPRASHSFDLNQKKQNIKAAHQHTKGSGILWKKLQTHSHIIAILMSCVTVMSYKTGGEGYNHL